MCDRDTVIENINKAYIEAVYPGDENLVTGDIKSDPEAEWIYQNLKGKHWKQLLHNLEQLEDGDLWQYHIVYSFLTPTAYCFYLPAFLITSLDSERSDTVGGSLVYSLMPPSNSTNEWRTQFFIERLERLTESQREAVGLFLQYLHTEEYVEPTLLTYWQQFVHF